jgi:hypothetical protein
MAIVCRFVLLVSEFNVDLPIVLEQDLLCHVFFSEADANFFLLHYVLNYRCHHVKTSNRSRSICNGPLWPVTRRNFCNGCCLAPVTHKRGRLDLELATTTPVTDEVFW